MRTVSFVRVIAMVLLPVPAMAQGPASTFDALRMTLHRDDLVLVKHADGHRSRGRVESVTSDELIVRPISRFRGLRTGPNLSYKEERVIEIKRRDPVNRGFAIGLTAGVALGVSPCFMAGDPGDADCLVSLILATPFFALVGMGTGALIDASINKTMYRHPTPQRTVTIGPMMGRGATGLSVAFAF
jgi:hypothetical protein